MSEAKRPGERAFKDALSLLQSGEQEKAKKYFSNLLQAEPNNIEFQAGFFCAGWWLNRKSSSHIYRNGRPLASWFMREWENFAKQANERGYNSCLCFQTSMHFALNEAANNFRQAFQEEGAASADPRLLKDLAICLIQLEDYSNAVDVLQYARSKAPQDARVCFLLGEALCCIGLEKKEEIGRGLSYYRDAFLIDFQVLEQDWIASQTATQVFTELYNAKQKDIDLTLIWFPAHLMAASFNYALRQLKSSEIESVRLEVKRLISEKDRVIEKYRERVHAILSFYLLVLIYQYAFSERNRHSAREYEEVLKQISLSLYETIARNEKSA